MTVTECLDFEVLDTIDSFQLEDLKKNLYFLILINLIFLNSIQKINQMIKVIDYQNENRITYYTYEKFLEIYDELGLDGFVA